MSKALRVEGVEELQAKLRRNANLNDVKRVVKLNGTELQKKAMRNAPVQTGTLKRSIELSIIDGGFTARVVAKTHYAGYVEYGTRYMFGRRYVGRAFQSQAFIFARDMKRLVKS